MSLSPRYQISASLSGLATGQLDLAAEFVTVAVALAPFYAVNTGGATISSDPGNIITLGGDGGLFASIAVSSLPALP